MGLRNRFGPVSGKIHVGGGGWVVTTISKVKVDGAHGLFISQQGMHTLNPHTLSALHKTNSFKGHLHVSHPRPSQLHPRTHF